MKVQKKHIRNAIKRINAYIIIKQCLAVLMLLLIFRQSFASKIEMPSIYSDNMVVQAGKPFIIRGRSTAGSVVMVTVKGKAITDTTDRNGFWLTQFPGLSDNTSFSIYITCEDNEIIIHNALAAELWLCSGQSNMQLPASRSDVLESIKDSTSGEIRYFLETADPKNTTMDGVYGNWIIVNKENRAQCSAVALSFAWNLGAAIHQPVGIIINAVGGTPIESWTPTDILKRRPYDRHIFDERQIWQRDHNKYEEQYALALKSWEDKMNKAKAGLAPKPQSIFPPFQLRSNWDPGCLFNTLMYPLKYERFKGVIWYQGESNANYPFVYRFQLKDLITSWRELFEDTRLPFYILQLPGYQTTDDWAVMRESQASATVFSNTFLIVSLDLGDKINIHPRQKMELGRRIALQVLKNSYNKDIVSSGPKYSRFTINGKNVWLAFLDSGSKLQSANGHPLANFEISDDGIHFVPAKAVIIGDSVEVWSEQVPHPQNVRYAWKNFLPDLNFINAAGLPSAPFFAGKTDKHLAAEEAASIKIREGITRQIDYAPRSAYNIRWMNHRKITKYSTGIKSITHSKNEYIFKRYSKKTIQKIAHSKVWDIRAHCTSGVTISFITNSTLLFVSGRVLTNSPQTKPFYIVCNHQLITPVEMETEGGHLSRVIKLPQELTKKEIEIVFPAYSQGIIDKVGIEKGSSLTRMRYRGQLVAYGNSITQLGGGYDGFLRIACHILKYSLYDAGIGGHIFQPNYLTGRLVKKPSVIIIEYGTNDWSGSKSADSARPFLKRLCQLYPNVPIAIIEPLYRYRPTDTEETNPHRNKLGHSLEEYRKNLAKIAGDFEQVTILHYSKLLPPDPGLYSDGVHPNEQGQGVMGKRLAEQILSIMQNKKDIL